MSGRFNGWLLPWAAAAITGILAFGTVHQFLVAWAPFVYIGVPVALVLSMPIVVAYASLARDGDNPSGTLFGFVVFSGFSAALRVDHHRDVGPDVR